MSDNLDMFLKNLQNKLEKSTNENKYLDLDEAGIFNNTDRLKFDYKNIKEECNINATEFVLSAFEFYFKDILNNELIQKDEHIKNKIKMDIVTISDELFVLKSSTFAIEKIIEMLNNGNDIMPKYFDSMSNVIKTKKEYNALVMQTQYFIKLSFESLRKSYDIALGLNKKNEDNLLTLPEKANIENLEEDLISNSGQILNLLYDKSNENEDKKIDIDNE